jgi:hypothetical protein
LVSLIDWGLRKMEKGERKGVEKCLLTKRAHDDLKATYCTSTPERCEALERAYAKLRDEFCPSVDPELLALISQLREKAERIHSKLIGLSPDGVPIPRAEAWSPPERLIEEAKEASNLMDKIDEKAALGGSIRLIAYDFITPLASIGDEQERKRYIESLETLAEVLKHKFESK